MSYYFSAVVLCYRLSGFFLYVVPVTATKLVLYDWLSFPIEIEWYGVEGKLLLLCILKEEVISFSYPIT